MRDSMRSRKLAKTIRSKTPGVDRITFDIIFQDQKDYDLVRHSGAVTRETVAVDGVGNYVTLKSAAMRLGRDTIPARAGNTTIDPLPYGSTAWVNPLYHPPNVLQKGLVLPANQPE